MKTWLASLPVTSPTKRRYHAALSSFCNYLVSVEVLPHNPMRDIAMPKAGRPRVRYLGKSDMLRLIEAQPEPYRTLSALLHGTGMEVSAALAAKREDLDIARRQLRAKGTKTASRDRIVKIAEWAWPYVERHARTLLPGAPLFDLGTRTLEKARDLAWKRHTAACRTLGIDDYRVHDARHSYAVRAIRAGAPLEVVSRQLGHENTIMVTQVYGRFVPTDADMTRWEAVADAQEAAEGGK